MKINLKTIANLAHTVLPKTAKYLDTVQSMRRPTPTDGTPTGDIRACIDDVLKAPKAWCAVLTAPVALPLHVARDIGQHAVQHPRITVATAAVITAGAVAGPLAKDSADS